MGDDLEEGLAVDGERLARAQRRAEVPLDHREHRLDLRPLAVEPPREAPRELPAPSALQPPWPAILPLPPADGRREDARHPQLLPTQDVRLLALVAGVAEDRAETVPRERLGHDTRELHHVRLRPPVDHSTQDEVALDVAERRKLRIPPLEVPRVPPARPGVVDRDVPGLETGRVDGGGPMRRRDQAAFAGELKRLVKESRRAFFFRSRLSA